MLLTCLTAGPMPNSHGRSHVWDRYTHAPSVTMNAIMAGCARRMSTPHSRASAIDSTVQPAMESGVSSNELDRHDQIDVPSCHCAIWYHQYAAAPYIAALTAASRTSGPNVPSSQCRGLVPWVQVNRNAPLSNSRATHGTPANRPARTGRARTATAMPFGIGLG